MHDKMLGKEKGKAVSQSKRQEASGKRQIAKNKAKVYSQNLCKTQFLVKLSKFLVSTATHGKWQDEARRG